MKKSTSAMLVNGLMAGLCLTGGAQAAVERFEVLTSTPVFDGREFGAAGGYERIDAIAHFAIDPASEQAQRVVDIEHAPTDDDGQVRYSTEVVILRPSDTERGSGVLLYDVPNRGRVLSFMLLDQGQGSEPPSSPESVGDGFLLEQGYTFVWSGWQTGLDDELLSLSVPTLEGVTGLSREEIVFDKPGTEGLLPLSYPAADTDPANASLSVRQYPEDARASAPGLSFEYLSDSEVRIHRPAGLDAGAIYEFIYPATDALPTGLGLTATSDLVSFLRGHEGHGADSPLTGIDTAVAMGISQSGRYLRDFVYQGFNADEGNARVFDAVLPYIAGSRKSFVNHRFAQQGRYSRHHEDHDFPGDQFPFSYVEIEDPISGRRESILSECAVSDTCPKVMHVDTSTEFWQARAALVSTAPDGSALSLPESVRLYFLAGIQHFAPFASQSEQSDSCRFGSNPVAAMPVLRTLVRSLVAWAHNDTPPPASNYPSVADGTLVDLAALALPDLPQDDLIPVYNTLRLRDHDSLPPAAGASYPVLVPQLDATGNPLGGIRLPRIAEPLATYWGWNLRSEGYAEGALCGLTGSMIPLSATETEGDSRPAISKRHADQAAYIDAVRQAANALVEQGFMRSEDVELVATRAAQDYQAIMP